MSGKTIEFGLVQKRITEAVFAATVNLPIGEAKKIDWLCSKADKYIAMDKNKAA